MLDFVDNTAYTNDQGKRAQKLFAAVVLAALDDAIADDKKYGNGVGTISHIWFHNPFLPSVAKALFSKFGYNDQYLNTIFLVTPPQNRKGSGQLLFGQINESQIWIIQN